VKAPRHSLLVLLTGVAAGTWWLVGSHDAGSPGYTPAPLATPGYYLTDATLEQTDATGQRTLLAHAARASQLEPNGDVALESPTVRYHTRAGRDWLMTARLGTLPAGQPRVDLEGDVELRADGAGGAVVRTEHLDLDVPAQVATTSDPVRIELARHTLLAHGLRADLTEESLRLEADVHGTFPR